jgi:hypothetical protein
MKQLFIKTRDVETAEELKRLGFKVINESGGMWTFLNDINIRFNADDNKKAVYSDRIEI